MLQNKILKFLFLFFLSSRIFFFVAALIAPLLLIQRTGYLGSNQNPLDHFLLWVWANFDGQHYLNIAVSGYQKNDFAFFPLYPALISLLNQLTQIPHLYLGITVSVLSFLIAMVMLYRITILDYRRNIALLALALLAFFPLSFYYHSIYTDSLFLLLSTTTFYFARKGNWFLAGVFGALSAFDRLSGLSLIPALAVEWYLQNKALIHQRQTFILSFFKNLTLTLSLTFSGFIAYVVYLQSNFGNWLLFQKSMIAWQQNEFVFPFQVFYRYLKIFISVSPGIFEYWKAVFEFLIFVLYMILTYYVFKKVRISYGIFMLVLWSLVTFTGTLWGAPRYTLHLFPGFIGLALLTDQNNTFKIALFILFLVLGFILTALFSRGYFVA